MIDDLDARLIELLATEPRIGVFEASRRLAVARGTVQARLDRLQRTGVIRDFAPTVDPAALGFPVSAYVTAEIAQGQRADFVGSLDPIPEVIEVHTITGQGDLLIRVVARSNNDLQRVIDQLVRHPHVTRTSTVIVMETLLDGRTLPLVHAAAPAPVSG